MRKIKIIISAIVLLTFKMAGQTPISEELYGINAWLINPSNTVIPTFANGFTSYTTEISASGVKYVRIGGIGPNWEQLYNFNSSTYSITTAIRLQYLINSIRAAGMEPMIQVSYNPVCSSMGPTSGYQSLGALTLTQQARVAANLVEYLNDPINGLYKDKTIKYWIIANEPDHSFSGCTGTASPGGGYSYNNPATHASLIATYVKEYSTQMKHKDPTIWIVGAEQAAFGSDDYYSGNNLMEALVSSPSASASTSFMGQISSSTYTGGNGKYFVDVLSFHHYAGIPGTTFTTAALMIDEPANHAKGFAKCLQTSASGYKGIIDMVQNGTGRAATNLSIACTEFNIDAHSTDNFATSYTNVVNGFDNRSFLGGQWLAETFAEAMKSNDGNGHRWISTMNLWSVREGSCAYTSTSNPLGYISPCTTGTVTDAKLPMYWHYEMVANHFKGNFYPCTSNSLPSDVKAFAAKSNDRIAVMILNQSNTDYTFGVSTQSNTTPSSGTLKFPFNITTNTLAAEYIADGTSSLKATLKANSTVLLIYNCVGIISERRDYTKASVLVSPAAQPTTTTLGPQLMGGQITWGGPPIIQNGSATYTFGPSGITFNWENPGPCGPITTGSNGTSAVLQVCNATQSVAYSYTATDTHGCTLPQKITIVGQTPVSGNYYAYINSITGASCGANNGSVKITPSHSPTYPSGQPRVDFSEKTS